jgi:MYXO-CTERM domain-containing protein
VPALPPARPVAPERPIALSPPSLAIATPVSPAASAPPVSSGSSGSGSSNTAFGLAALIGAGGLALLRARQLSAAAGIGDIGTLTALGHSASTFWAGSCLTLSSGGATSATANASLTASATSPANALGSRAQFGVGGVVSGAADAAGGHFTEPVASVVPGGDGSDDRTPLVALLFACSAIIGAAIGAIGPRRQAGA